MAFAEPCLCPPHAFGIVEPGVYRCNSPSEENLAFLARLKLKTILYLSPAVLLRAVANFLQQSQITLHNLGLQAWRPEASWTPITQELMKDALELVLDVRNHPLLVCCTSGIHQTGTLVGCLRRLQGWGLTCTLDEYSLYAGNRVRVVHEQFIELFDTDLVRLPQHLPEWMILPRTLAQEEEQEIERAQEEGDHGKAQTLVLYRLAAPSKLVSPVVSFNAKSLVDDEDDD
mmetsp:Transcript_1961/g.5420  ORF Transcript_1961/g.5420 Transcript_1961/m.5420 type:complete len:230 (+) Transcript_1961:2-691(+)